MTNRLLPTAATRRALVLGLMLAGALAGCQSVGGRPETQIVNAIPLASAPLPSPTVGEAYTFSDGHVNTVMSVRADRVVWRDGYGIFRTHHRNPFLPEAGWQNRTRRLVATTTASPSLLWPLAVEGLGHRALFDVHQILERNDGSGRREFDQSWECVLDGTESVTVPAGTFDTYRVNCYRYSAGTTYWRETRTFNYAPSIGYYVLYQEHKHTGPSKVRELVSAGFDSRALPEDEQQAIIATLTAALEKNADGKSATWARKGGGLSVEITPTGSFAGTKGEPCRSYRSAYTYATQRRENAKKICKAPDGGWRLVP